MVVGEQQQQKKKKKRKKTGKTRIGNGERKRERGGTTRGSELDARERERDPIESEERGLTIVLNARSYNMHSQNPPYPTSPLSQTSSSFASPPPPPIDHE